MRTILDRYWVYCPVLSQGMMVFQNHSQLLHTKVDQISILAFGFSEKRSAEKVARLSSLDCSQHQVVDFSSLVRLVW